MGVLPCGPVLRAIRICVYMALVWGIVNRSQRHMTRALPCLDMRLTTALAPPKAFHPPPALTKQIPSWSYPFVHWQQHLPRSCIGLDAILVAIPCSNHPAQYRFAMIGTRTGSPRQALSGSSRRTCHETPCLAGHCGIVAGVFGWPNAGNAPLTRPLAIMRAHPHARPEFRRGIRGRHVSGMGSSKQVILLPQRWHVLTARRPPVGKAYARPPLTAWPSSSRQHTACTLSSLRQSD